MGNAEERISVHYVNKFTVSLSGDGQEMLVKMKVQTPNVDDDDNTTGTIDSDIVYVAMTSHNAAKLVTCITELMNDNPKTRAKSGE